MSASADGPAPGGAWDPGAFARFYRRHERTVRGVLLRRTGREDLSADLTSEVFAAALLALRRGDRIAVSERAWLLGIAQHKLIDSLRRGRVEDAARRELRSRPPEASDESLAAIEALTAETPALELLDALPDEQRYAVRARVLDERSYAEIARELDLSEQAVRKRVSRGLARVRSALLVAGPLAAVIVAVVFLTTVHHPRAPVGGTSTRPPAVNRSGAFPGAPRTQSFNPAGDICPLARPDRYLPPRSGCVSVVRADVDGDGRPDLVLLYAHLSRHEIQGEFVPDGFTLQVVRASGGVARTRVPTSTMEASDEAIVEYGNVNDAPGDELVIEEMSLSSGSYGLLYTFADGRLVRLPVTLQWGGDSGVQSGFACRGVGGPRPRLVLRTFLLERGGEDGSWRETTNGYTWRGAALVEIARGVGVERGFPPSMQTRLGSGCGTLTRYGHVADGTISLSGPR